MRLAQSRSTARVELNPRQVDAALFAIREIMEADILVIGAPMYNFTIHSTLKAWIDHIVRKGITFGYSEKSLAAVVDAVGPQAATRIVSGNITEFLGL